MGTVEGIRPHLGDVGWVARGAREEGHELGRGPVGDARHDLGVNVGGDVGERLWV